MERTCRCLGPTAPSRDASAPLPPLLLPDARAFRQEDTARVGFDFDGAHRAILAARLGEGLRFRGKREDDRAEGQRDEGKKGEDPDRVSPRGIGDGQKADADDQTGGRRAGPADAARDGTAANRCGPSTWTPPRRRIAR